MSNDDSVADHSDKKAVDQTIKQRKTAKIMLPVEKREDMEVQWNDQHQQTLDEMIALAAWAPFHRRSHDMHRQGSCDALMPWRFHVLRGAGVTSLLKYFETQVNNGVDEKWARAWQSKIKDMLSACGALVQVTWLPDPSDDSDLPEMSRNNIEHVAAAGAAVQNLLLAAEARHWQSYWSSGGILRDPEIFDFMGIAQQEHLLGSIFLTPSVHPDAKVVAGGLRDQRGDISGWVRLVD